MSSDPNSDGYATRQKTRGVDLNTAPKSQLTSISAINGKDAEKIIALRGSDGQLSLADVISQTNLTEEKLVELNKKTWRSISMT